MYVGMSNYSPAQRFDQHKAGIRAAGSVLKRGLEVLTGPRCTCSRSSARRPRASKWSSRNASRQAGLMVKGGH